MPIARMIMSRSVALLRIGILAMKGIKNERGREAKREGP